MKIIAKKIAFDFKSITLIIEPKVAYKNTCIHPINAPVTHKLKLIKLESVAYVQI